MRRRYAVRGTLACNKPLALPYSWLLSLLEAEQGKETIRSCVRGILVQKEIGHEGIVRYEGIPSLFAKSYGYRSKNISPQ